MIVSSYNKISLICKSGNRRLFYFSHFSNNSKKIKNSKISLLAVNSIFCIFEFNFKIRKMKKMIDFPDHFLFSLFLLYFEICKYDKDK